MLLEHLQDRASLSKGEGRGRDEDANGALAHGPQGLTGDGGHGERGLRCRVLHCCEEPGKGFSRNLSETEVRTSYNSVCTSYKVPPPQPGTIGLCPFHHRDTHLTICLAKLSLPPSLRQHRRHRARAHSGRGPHALSSASASPLDGAPLASSPCRLRRP